MAFTVRALDSVDTKSVAQVEEELLKKHEEGNNPPAPSEDPPPPPAEENPPAPVEDTELEESKVLSYIGKRYNKEIKSLDELIETRNQNEDLPEDVSAFLKYKKETGRGIDDFIKLNRDYESIDQDVLLREYLKSTQEELDDDDIDIQMEDYTFDEDLDDESHIKKVKIERKKIISEAKKYFNNLKEQYKVPLESSRSPLPPEEDEEYKQFRQYVQNAKTIEEEAENKRKWFDQKTAEIFSNEFKGFEFSINDKKIVFSPGDAMELKKVHSNPQNFIKKYLDDKGLLKDAEGYHKSLAIAMNPEKFAKFFYEQGLSDGVGNYDKKIKNVNMTTNRVPEITKSNDGMKVREVNPDHGKGLKIRSAKRL